MFKLLTRCASCCQFLWLPPQATHSHHRVSLDFLFTAPGSVRFPGHFGGVSSQLEITANFHRCKIFLNYFAKFCKRAGWYEGNECRVVSRESRASSLHSGSFPPGRDRQVLRQTMAPGTRPRRKPHSSPKIVLTRNARLPTRDYSRPCSRSPPAGLPGSAWPARAAVLWSARRAAWGR